MFDRPDLVPPPIIDQHGRVEDGRRTELADAHRERDLTLPHLKQHEARGTGRVEEHGVCSPCPYHHGHIIADRRPGLGTAQGILGQYI